MSLFRVDVRLFVGPLGDLAGKREVEDLASKETLSFVLGSMRFLGLRLRVEVERGRGDIGEKVRRNPPVPLIVSIQSTRKNGGREPLKDARQPRVCGGADS
jgi:hypothetical protein